jgi:conjugal transfer/entry exclusion protein
VHKQKIMSDASNTMKKREKLQSKGQQEKTYKQDVQGMDTELSKGAESERERSTKRPGTGA